MLKTRGIVFRTIKYGETSVIADIYTEEKGLHTFIAGGVRSAKSRMSFGLFQPMSVVDLVSYFKEDTKALHRIKELRAAAVYSALPFDIRRGAIALFMAEICRKSIQEACENQELFNFLLDNLSWLDTTPHPLANLHLHFLVGLSALLGFQPHSDPESDEACYFDLKEGVYGPTPPLHQQYLAPDQSSQFRMLIQAPLDQCHALPFTRAARKALLQKLLLFYQFHVPEFSDVHTPAILEMVMEG